MKTILSLGAGRQSSTIALMASIGEITPMPDAAIFSDTGAEPKTVYKWLDWLEKQLPFPVYRVKKEQGLKINIIDSINSGSRFASAPFFTESEGGGGMLRRQCTREFKIEPITKKLREIVGLVPYQRAPKNTILVEQWIGISLDEIQRIKDAKEKWISTRWPLIEKRMTAGHCLEWMKHHSYPEPPRSACTFCPYHSDKEWRNIKTKDQESWDEALKIDRLIRNGVRGTKEKLYLHRSQQPLDQVDFSSAEDNGQMVISFMDECDGMCGV